MCVEKREERHEKRDTHVCGSVRVSTGTEIYLAHTLTQIVLSHSLSHWLSYAIRIRNTALSCAQQTDSTLKPQGGRYQANAQSHVEALKLNEKNTHRS